MHAALRSVTERRLVEGRSLILEPTVTVVAWETNSNYQYLDEVMPVNAEAQAAQG